MSTRISHEKAWQLLGYIILDANDIRDHFSKRT